MNKKKLIMNNLLLFMINRAIIPGNEPIGGKNGTTLLHMYLPEPSTARIAPASKAVIPSNGQCHP